MMMSSGMSVQMSRINLTAPAAAAAAAVASSAVAIAPAPPSTGASWPQQIKIGGISSSRRTTTTTTTIGKTIAAKKAARPSTKKTLKANKTANANTTKKTKTTKKKAKKKGAMNDPEGPAPPLNAYNFFFKYQRAAMLHSDDPANIGTPSPTPRAYYSTHVLQPHLKDKVDKKKRSHRKTHGKIGFTDLVRLVAGRWRALGAEEKAFFSSLAETDMARWKRERAELVKRREKTKTMTMTMTVAKIGSGGGGEKIEQDAVVSTPNEPAQDSGSGSCLPVLTSSLAAANAPSSSKSKTVKKNTSIASPSLRFSLPTTELLEREEADSSGNRGDDAPEPLAYIPIMAAAAATPSSRRASLPIEPAEAQQTYQTRAPSPFDDQTLSDIRAVTSCYAYATTAASTTATEQTRSACYNFPSDATTAGAASVTTSASAPARVSFVPRFQQPPQKSLGFIPISAVFGGDDEHDCNKTSRVTASTAASSFFEDDDDDASLGMADTSAEEEERRIENDADDDNFSRRLLRRCASQLQASKKKTKLEQYDDDLIDRVMETSLHCPSAPDPSPACHPQRQAAAASASASAMATTGRYSPIPLHGKQPPPSEEELAMSLVPARSAHHFDVPYSSWDDEPFAPPEVASAKKLSSSFTTAPVVKPLVAFDNEEMDFLGRCCWDDRQCF